MRLTLLLALASPLWSGTITLPMAATATCTVSYNNVLMSNNCNSIQGIYADIHNDGSMIQVHWGTAFTVEFIAAYTLTLDNYADLGMVEAGSISGMVKYDQNFIAAGSGYGYVTRTMPTFGECCGASAGATIDTGFSDGEMVRFEFGVPFHLSVFASINASASAGGLGGHRGLAGYMQPSNGFQFFDAQFHPIYGLDIEPTDQAMPTSSSIATPEAGTWLLTMAGLAALYHRRSNGGFA